MTDIAALGIAVDRSSIAKADAALDELARAAKPAEDAITKLTASLQAGDRAGALAAYEESLSIARALAKDKGDAQAQRDLSVSLNRIGNVKIRRATAPGRWRPTRRACRSTARWPRTRAMRRRSATCR